MDQEDSGINSLPGRSDLNAYRCGGSSNQSGVEKAVFLGTFVELQIETSLIIVVVIPILIRVFTESIIWGREG